MPPRLPRRTATRLLQGLASVMLFAAGPLAAQSVLNTERVDPRDVAGFFTRLEIGATLHGGNSDVLDLKGNGALGYRGRRSWIVLVGGLAYLSSADSVATDDRFAQVRYGWFLSGRTRTFHFVQIQNSREQLLSHRLLLGSGVRHAFLSSDSDRVDAGIGLMWESERLDKGGLPPGTRTISRDVRGDLIAFASHRLSSVARLNEMLYVEPRVDAPADVRFLEDLRLAVTVVKGIDLNVTMHWLHDSRPPPSVGPDDVQLETSVSATVR